MSKIYKHIVVPGQNLIDVAMQCYGTAESIVNLCIDNSLDIGQEISPGQELLINEDYITDSKLVAYYKSNNTIVASE